MASSKLISSFNEEAKSYFDGFWYKFMFVPMQNEFLRMLGDSVLDIIVNKSNGQFGLHVSWMKLNTSQPLSKFASA